MTVAVLVPQIELVIIEDHPPVRQGLEVLLTREGFRTIGWAESASDGARMICARRPDVALVDIALGDGSGIDVARSVADTAPGTAVVLYTGSISRDVLEDAVGSGVCAVVLKSSPLSALTDAIRAAAAGLTYVDTAVAAAVARTIGRDGVRRTTEREGQVLGLLAHGRTVEQIATELVVTPETVRTHIRNATRRLGARGRLHAVIVALLDGEIDVADMTGATR